MNTRILFLLGLFLTAVAPSFAQVQFVPNGAHRFSAGIGGGVARLYGDLPNRSMTPVGRINVEYKLKEFLSFGLEGQIGTLETGVKNAVPDAAGRYLRSSSWGLHSVNSFQAVNAYGRVGIGMLTEDNEDLSRLIKNIYAGIGFGIIRNSMSDIVARFPENNAKISNVKDKSIGIALPISAGINVDIPGTNITGNFNVQYNITNSEGLDGYDFTSGGLKKDGYLFISLGVKYNFGPLL
ncbi:MAG: hypothetical protein EOP56_11445 [Sphingobacteriales bacterium]|nr:MAG: hypothetical protein EOP56_11445 [Sphingobacteriales bacterium]